MNVILIECIALPLFRNGIMKCLRLEGFAPVKIGLCRFRFYCEEEKYPSIFEDIKQNILYSLLNHKIIKVL